MKIALKPYKNRKFGETQDLHNSKALLGIEPIGNK